MRNVIPKMLDLLNGSSNESDNEHLNEILPVRARAKQPLD